MRRFARLAVDRLGARAAPAAAAVVLPYRVLRALSPETLMAQLLDALLGRPGARRAGRAGRPADDAASGSAAFQDAVEAEVRRRIAEERAGTRSPRPPCSRWPSRSTSCAPSRRPGRAAPAGRTRWPAGWRPADRHAPAGPGGPAGLPPDRAGLAGHRRRAARHPPPAAQAAQARAGRALRRQRLRRRLRHFTLMLTYALREQFTKVRAFAFIDTVDEVTRFFAPGADVADAMPRMGREADLVGFDGHSDYGHALRGVRREVPGGGRAEDVAADPRRRPHQLPPARRCPRWPTWCGGRGTRTGSTPSRDG